MRRRAGFVAHVSSGKHLRRQETPVIDHLIYGTPDLTATVAELSGRFGLRLSEGGQHLGLGTRNFLADLGGRRYLEVVGPDPEQPDPGGPRLFDVGSLREPRLVTWACRVDDLTHTGNRLHAAGYDLSPSRAMTRESADGVPITWRMTTPMNDAEYGGLVPFFIEWGDSAHPADRAAPGMRLVSLTARTSDVAGLRSRLEVLDEALPVEQAAQPGLRAVLETPAGDVVLD